MIENVYDLTTSLPGSDGVNHSLSEFNGSWSVIYFYPKDDTPGCTTEACGFRDANDDLKALGVNVVGISADDTASHDKFRSKYNLNFLLLSDESHELIKQFGAWGKKMFGKEGILRQTFIVRPDGSIAKADRKVSPEGHAEKVLELLKDLV